MKGLLEFVLAAILTLGGFSSNGQSIQWMSFEEAVEAQKQSEKKILVDLYTDWCGWCKRMDQTTLSDREIVQYINKNYHPVKFNAEMEREVEFKGKTYRLVKRSGKRNYHELAAHISRNQLSYPTLIFFDEECEVIQPLKGYQDPATFKAIMTYIAEDHYKKTPWRKYKAEFEGIR